MSDPRCEVCADAYGTHFVCARCRADEANVGWVCGRGVEPLDVETLDPRRALIVAALARVRIGASDATHAEIAAACDVSRSRVSEIHEELLLLKLYRYRGLDRVAEPEEADLVDFGRLYMNPTDQAIVNAAWFEWRCGASPPIDEFEPPRWFTRDELGYDLGSTEWLGKTCRGLARQNAEALCALDEPHLRVTYPRNFYPDAAD